MQACTEADNQGLKKVKAAISEFRELNTRYQKVLDDLREKEKKDEQMEEDVTNLVKRFLGVVMARMSGYENPREP